MFPRANTNGLKHMYSLTEAIIIYVNKPVIHILKNANNRI